ncbi:MAG TPA: hypothetical protein VII56_18425 [Rhizomicrobium sp.]
MQGWHEFYEMIGAAAATLLGLLFVSVSLNADVILGPAHAHSKRLAEQAFQNYICVLLVSLLVIFPGMSLISLGNSILWMTTMWGAWVVYRMYHVVAGPLSGESRTRSLRRYLPTFLGFGALVYAAARITLKQGDYTDWIAGGAIALLIAATIMSWELLIRIAEEKYAARKD